MKSGRFTPKECKATVPAISRSRSTYLFATDDEITSGAFGVENDNESA